ncbi:MAG: sugar ABC transporter permease [Thermomicrobiales bacterium]|nr:sugar ABC transporter permease [Thermomicrobiales bacterium]
MDRSTGSTYRWSPGSWWRRHSERVALGSMLVPYLLGLALLVVGPALAGFALSLTDYNAIQTPRWAGLANFRRLPGDHIFRIAVFNSLLYIALAVPIRLAGAFLLARLLLRPSRSTRLGRVIVYLPTVIPDLAWALIWLWILNPIYGPLNQLLGWFGIAGPAWMVDPTTARFGIVLMMIWQLGEGFIVCLAALQGLDRDLLDQAAVDGAGRWHTLREIMLPLVAPALLILLVRDTIFSFQANFVPALIVGKGGGPDYATMYLPMYIYDVAFVYLRFGYAAAMTVAMYAITGVILFFQYRLTRRWHEGFGRGA